MGAIGGPTAKRHRLWSNSKPLLDKVSNDAGYLSLDDMLKLPGGPLVRKYKDRNGILRTCWGSRQIEKFTVLWIN